VPNNNDDDMNYAEPKFSFAPIMDAHIQRAIARLGPFTAPGTDGIMNIAFIQCTDLLVPHLAPIYRVTFKFKVYPDQLKSSTTVVLGKLTKLDYTAPGAYHPIALLNTMAKILSACVADILVYMAETHNMLPDNHFSCRPGRTTTDSLHFVTKYIKDTWRKGKVVSALFLDIKSTFPSMMLGQLLCNMRMRGMLAESVEWIRLKVTGRTTTLSFDRYASEPISLLRGIDQGCLLSGILFKFYNADLIDICGPEGNEMVVTFVDDALLLACS